MPTELVRQIRSAMMVIPVNQTSIIRDELPQLLQALSAMTACQNLRIYVHVEAPFWK